MDGERLDAAVLQLLSQVDDDLGALVPSETSLHRHGSLHRIDHRAHDVEHQRHILQHACSRPFACHTLHGTAEVEVYDIGLHRLHDACRLCHRVHVTPIDLYRHGALLVADGELLHRLVYLTDEGIARHELRVHEVGTKLLAHQPEAQVSNILHRCQQHRILA